MNKEYKRLLIFLSVFLFILIVFILYAAWPIITGKTVILATMPIDPFDIFRGQYLAINYEISRIPVIEGINAGDTIYVALKKDENHTYRYAVASLKNNFKLNFEPVIIKGQVKSIWGGNMNIEYGIEQYFFERNAWVSNRITNVEVKVDESGNARIIRLLNATLGPAEIKYSDSLA
jgi:uncharacterized membrane-anchored protein